MISEAEVKSRADFIIGRMSSLGFEVEETDSSASVQLPGVSFGVSFGVYYDPADGLYARLYALSLLRYHVTCAEYGLSDPFED